MRAAKPDSRNRRIDLHDSLSVAEHLAPEGKLDGFYVGDAVTVLILGQERLRFAIEDLDLIVRQGTQCQGVVHEGNVGFDAFAGEAQESGSLTDSSLYVAGAGWGEIGSARLRERVCQSV